MHLVEFFHVYLFLTCDVIPLLKEILLQLSLLLGFVHIEFEIGFQNGYLELLLSREVERSQGVGLCRVPIVELLRERGTAMVAVEFQLAEMKPDSNDIVVEKCHARTQVVLMSIQMPEAHGQLTVWTDDVRFRHTPVAASICMLAEVSS